MTAFDNRRQGGTKPPSTSPRRLAEAGLGDRVGRPGRRMAERWAPLRAVTLDLWGTILYPRDPEGKIERRREMLLAAICGAGHECSLEQLRGGFRAAQRVVEEAVARDFRDVGPPGRWEGLMRQLGFPPESVPFSAVEAAYEDLTLEFLPPLLDGVAEAIDRLAGRYRLGLICNTGYTGGRVLRQVLERHDLARYFKVLTFSNEFGWLKPDPRIFHHTLDQLDSRPEEALHVGDMEELDVAGARAAGLYAARYLPDGDNDGAIQTEADLVFSDWAEFYDLIDAKQAPG
jgi:putative hydrolase of the HAD superfamily